MTFAGIVRFLMIFAFAQGAVQLLGAASGILVARYMSISDYASFAILTTAISAIVVGSDAGLTQSLNHFMTRNSSQKFFLYVRSAFKLRRLFFVIFAVTGTLFVYTSIQGENVTFTEKALLISAVIMSAYLSIDSRLFVQITRLLGFQNKSYVPDLMASSVKFLLVVLAVFLGQMKLGYVICILVLSNLVLFFVSRHFAVRQKPPVHVENGSEVEEEVDKEVRSYVFPMIPGVFVFIVQQPVVYWAAGYFGGVEVLASVFAVNRFSIVIAMLGLFATAVAMPQVSRAPFAERRNVIIKFGAVLISLVLVAVAFVWVFSGFLLTLLGSKYSGLTLELVVCILATSFTVLNAYLVGVNRILGWTDLEPVAAIVISFGSIALCYFWDYSTAASVALLFLAISVLSTSAVVGCSLLYAVRPQFEKMEQRNL